MKTYIALLNWTQKGIQEFRESPSRVEKARELIERNGGKMKSFYMTMGRYDMVSVIEAPDDATYAKFMLVLASKGGVRTETLSAFTEDEYRSIVDAAT
jgi:uncharacterized protein with GYD domain